MTTCLILQPIDEDAVERLRAAGLTVRLPGNGQVFEDGMTDLLSDADAVVTRNLGFRAEWMDLAPRLRVIAVHGTGTDAVDLPHATRSGVQVVNTPGANAQAVAEHTFALLLALVKRLGEADSQTRAGNFGFRYMAAPGDLYGRHLGIWGAGHVAQRVARIGLAFGMQVSAFSRHGPSETLRALGVAEVADLDELCRRADVLSVHASPHVDGVHIDACRIRLLGGRGILLNTARGGLVDERALAAALCDGELAAAAIDTFEKEPPDTDHPLFRAPNTLFTPHLAGASLGALRATGQEVVEALLSALDGRAGRSLCNPEVLTGPQLRTTVLPPFSGGSTAGEPG